MFLQQVRNVCQALSGTVRYLNTHAEYEESRVGKVLVSPQPMCTVIFNPTERVLFSAVRDANPFFHMFEAIWMMAGRHDARILDWFIQDFSKNYAEKDGDIHGAYGYRWRHHFGYDQLDAVVQKLINQPYDRQAVIQMWDAHKDRANDLLGDWRDKPCNDIIFLRRIDNSLDMTVCCRSNDMIWGAHGANAVHFSILLEYLAARIDLGVGHLTQISNNAHVYLETYNKIISRASPEQLMDDRYSIDKTIKPIPMFKDVEHIDDDFDLFYSWTRNAIEDDTIDIDPHLFHNEWFPTVAAPTIMAFRAYKKKDFKGGLALAKEIMAPDWQMACYEWIQRRNKWIPPVK